MGGRKAKNGKSGEVPTMAPTCKKMVESLKEIVNCSEHEIYAMLKECNMDPNDAVQRLISQDTFHEVKSKRERRKEIKQTQESTSRGISGASNRAVKSIDDCNFRHNGPNQFSSNESGKPAYTRENGSVGPPLSSSSTSPMAGINMNPWPPSHSNSFTAEHRTQEIGTGYAISSSAQPSLLGVPGRVSMADIVKMGRPHSKASSSPIMSTGNSYPPHDAVAPNSSHQHIKHPHVSTTLRAESHQDLNSQNPSDVSEIIHEPGITANNHVFHDQWPLVEQSMAAGGSSVLDASGAPGSVMYSKSYLHSDRANLSLNGQLDDIQVSEGDLVLENRNTDHIGSASISSRQIMVDSAGGSSHFGNDSLEDMSSYHSHRHASEHQEGICGDSHLTFPNHSAPLTDDVIVAVSSAAANLQQLCLQEEELMVPPVEDNPAVVIPNHLRAPIPDCSHLTFGSFRFSIDSAFSDSLESNSLKSDLEEASVAPNGSSIGHSDTRNVEYHGYGQLRSMPDAHRAAEDARNYDSPSQPELTKQDTLEAIHGHQYDFPSSEPDHIFENSQQPYSALSYVQRNPQDRNLPPFPNVMNTYSNPPLSNLLDSTVQSIRESDHLYSPFLETQLMPSKYRAMSSMSNPMISMTEVLKSENFSVPQPTRQTLPGLAIPQQPTMHSYSQTIPSGQSSNMISNQFLPRGNTYMPSSFQQAHPGSIAFHQSLAAVESAGMKYALPEYRSSVSASSLLQSAAIASGYGGFRSSTNILGSFPQNQPSAPTGHTIGSGDNLNSRYKDGNYFIPRQQSESSTTWVHRLGSRTMSAVPASTYYGLQGQDQHHPGFRRSQQQPPQRHEALGYTDLYNSPTGITQEHRQQRLSDESVSGSRGPSTQWKQIWQNGY